MDYLHTFESLNESKDLETLKKKVLDFAEKKGKSRWKDLHSFILKQKGLEYVLYKLFRHDLKYYLPR